MRSENDIIDEMKTEACNQCRHEVLSARASELLAFLQSESRGRIDALPVVEEVLAQWRAWARENNVCVPPAFNYGHLRPRITS